MNETSENNITTNNEIVSEIENENIQQTNENTVVDSPQGNNKTNNNIEETKNNSQTNKPTKVQNEKVEIKPNKPPNKDFLFEDGYTMENVTGVAQDYLKSSGYAGECIPLKDNEGVYIGMRVIFY